MAGDYFITEILSRAPGKDHSGNSPARRRPSSRRGEYFSAVDDEVLHTVACRAGFFEDWRDAGCLDAHDLFLMAAQEPAQARQRGDGHLGWRAYLNAAALREITRGEG